MPSVICDAFPSAIEYTKIARRWLSSPFEYAIQRESDDHVGWSDRPGSAYVSLSSFVDLPVAGSITHTLRWLSSNERCLPSGDHSSDEKNAADGSAIARGFST